MRAKMSDGVKRTVTIINILLIIAGIAGILLLSKGIRNSETTGTFGLFGRSFHLNQSAAMSPLIEKNDLIVIRQKPATSFQQGDMIAYYIEQDGRDFLLVRNLVLIDGTEYVLTDGKGTETTLSATETRFLGTVEAHSAALGTAVQFLQTEDGKTIFLGWTAGVLLFLLGFIILLHVIIKNIGRTPGENSLVQSDLPAENEDDSFSQEPLDFNQIIMDIQAQENSSHPAK